MQYVGSKRRFAKDILQIISPSFRGGMTYVEPFVGGGAMFSIVPWPKLGADVNPYLIALHQALQLGWIPPTDLSKELYIDIRDNKGKYPPELVAFVGFGCSFGGKWFASYAQNKSFHNYARQASNFSMKKACGYRNATFICSDYRSLAIPTEAIIYCDPPYAGSRVYGPYCKIDYVEFWSWVRQQEDFGHPTFVSEYTAPDDFTCVWSKEYTCSLDVNKPTNRTERLFRWTQCKTAQPV